ncbi:MAG TPA: hypothetical protein VKT82_20140 [Ktedonobacterales bacterium]|nr:hypothetical protein [Ktedonobacterales bacterium]
MINWVHDVVIVLISTGLATLFAGGGWLYRWWRDKKNTRLLVAIEILVNQTQLNTFVMTLHDLSVQDRRIMALHLDRAEMYYHPTWLRVRWDSVSPGIFSPKEIYKIGLWYYQLENISDGNRHILSHSALRRQLAEKNKATEDGQIDFIVEQIANLESFAQTVLKEGPPFTDKRFKQTYEEARKHWDALRPGQEGPEA